MDTSKLLETGAIIVAALAFTIRTLVEHLTHRKSSRDGAAEKLDAIPRENQLTLLTLSAQVQAIQRDNDQYQRWRDEQTRTLHERLSGIEAALKERER